MIILWHEKVFGVCFVNIYRMISRGAAKMKNTNDVPSRGRDGREDAARRIMFTR